MPGQRHVALREWAGVRRVLDRRVRRPEDEARARNATRHSARAGVVVGVLAVLLSALPGARVSPPKPSPGAPAETLGTSGPARLALRLRGDGAPLEGRLTLRVPGLDPIESRVSGRVVLGPLPTGRADLLMEASGWVRYRSSVELTPGLRERTVTLTRATPLAGEVVDERGQPVAAALVEARMAGQPVWTTETDRAGRFEIDTIAPGAVSLVARAYAHETVVRDVPADPDERRPLRLRVPRTAVLAGRVYGPRGAAGAASVEIAGSGLWPPRTLETDASGHFRLEGLAAGIYELRASSGGLVAAPREGLVLAPGRPAFVTLRLSPGVALFGTLTDAQSGEPVADAEVRVTDNGLGLAPRTAQSDADGRFRVPGLRPGTHRLSVWAEGYVAQRGREVRGGKPVDLALSPGATLRGVVIDSRHAPLEGAEIEVVGRGPDGRLASLLATVGGGLRDAMSAAAKPRPPESLDAQGHLGVVAGPVPPIPTGSASELGPTGIVAPQPTNEVQAALGRHRTDSEGRFELHGVPPGTVQLVVRHRGHAPASTAPRTVRPGETVEGLEIEVPDGGRIEGRLVDARGFPVARVPVELRMEVEPLPRFAVSQEDGRFEFEAVLGATVLTALPNGRPTARTAARVGRRSVREVELELPDAHRTLAGRVLDPEAYPVEGALLTLRSLRAETPVERTAWTEPDGTFHFDGLPAPPYRVEVDHPRFAPASIDARDDEELEVELEAGAAVRGHARDALGDVPLEGVKVRLVSRGDPAGTVAQATTGPEGEFELRVVRAGDYTVTFTKDGFLQARRALAHEAGPRGLEATTIAPVELSPAAAASGIVVDVLGDPVPGAEVTRGDGWEDAVRTGPAGRFELPGLEPGTHRITARHPAAGQRASRPLRLEPRGHRDGLRLRLPARYQAVATEAGTVRSGVQVELEAATVDGEPAARVREAPDGGLVAGDVVVAVDHQQVRGVAEARRALRGPAGVDAIVDVIRSGERHRLLVPRRRHLAAP